MVDDAQRSPGVRVRVRGLPTWLDASPLLGSEALALSPAAADGRRSAEGVLSRRDAADLAARLRGVGIDGQLLEVAIDPPLPRKLVRAARSEDARRRRDTSPGFRRRGVRLDDEGRYSLTPEDLALSIGSAAQAAGLSRVLDLGAGVGGNAIGFARAGCRVLAVERDAERARMARHNAAVYEVADRVEVRHGDALQLLQHPADLWFVDPPWGTDWDRASTGLTAFPLLRALHAQPGRPALWAKLPPSFEVGQLPGAVAGAHFGVAEGDRHRVKFVLLRCPALARH